MVSSYCDFILCEGGGPIAQFPPLPNAGVFSAVANFDHDAHVGWAGVAPVCHLVAIDWMI